MEMDGELIGSASIVSYGSVFGFVGLFIIRPEWRGRGLRIGHRSPLPSERRRETACSPVRSGRTGATAANTVPEPKPQADPSVAASSEAAQVGSERKGRGRGRDVRVGRRPRSVEGREDGLRGGGRGDDGVDAQAAAAEGTAKGVGVPGAPEQECPLHPAGRREESSVVEAGPVGDREDVRSDVLCTTRQG